MLETKRLILRPLESTDSDAIFSYRSDSQANKYQSWVPKTKEEVAAFISKIPNHFNVPKTWFQLAIVEKDSGKLIGDIGIHFMDTENHQCELGCTINKEYQKNGFAFDALDALVDFLFRQLNKHRITASIDPENVASIRLFEKLKFRKEAHFHKSLLLNGKWCDDVVYALLRSEWVDI